MRNGGRKDPEDPTGINTFFVQMGQFIDHDLTLTPEHEHEPGKGCCGRNSDGLDWVWTGEYKKDKCIPIKIPVDDKYWRGSNRTCFDVRRSRPALRIPSCQANKTREQMDAITHWLDASNVYGSTEQEMDSVRVSNSSFRLKVTSSPGQERRGRAQLPTCEAVKREERHSEINACEAPCDKADCRVAGDQRVNEQPGLTALHTVWVREHNRLAEQLHNLNSHWGPGRVFQVWSLSHLVT